ncbi:ribosomal protein L11 methyltransferase [Alcaligenes pakistanensis]|uniref:Ribosomal protein L11 methyltransferase n=1 Tax=Alcaligenes pakistanensis TaxID=1482717 RepID=A0A8H9IMV2_9BURK|nr:50S ribosomal protein L11 methyltransferase [Alcaligenes pakistanensis]MBP6621131.1 50S ribosomal protein L11 methyltransferase [Alcaligenes sp.]GHC48546.1 ribosomal protein L11 methyltransferase [Alcaligenes pakistanensis]HCA17604.1 50S ribosomal protein L11 methyltransferase [Alcaligenes faecalis]
MRELLLSCQEHEAERLSDALLEAGALSVSVEDADGDTEQEKPLFGEPGIEPDVLAWDRNWVVALLPEDLEPEELLQPLFDAGVLTPEQAQWSVRDVPDQDWVRLTQSQFGPIPVGDRILIVPSWHKDDEDLPLAQEGDDGLVRIELDPGLAFGTGSHPTTHLCLDWLAHHVQPGQTVLDYGCGSGILAIAARKLGAGTTVGVDIDEQAVIATRYNAQVNQVEVEGLLPDAMPAGQTDLVVANILANPLRMLAPMLANRVKPGGHLILSGIYDWQAEEMIEVYAAYLPLSVWQMRDGWVCLAGQRPF